jgi:hypothetical protein
VVTGVGSEVEAVFEALITNAAVVAADDALLNPSQAGGPNAPTSITHAAFTVPSSGPTLAALSADLGRIADHMEAAGVRLVAPVVIMSAGSALRVGGLALPGGGFSLPVVTTPAAENQVVLLDGSRLAYTNGGLEIDLTREATVELSDAPVADISTPTAPPTLVFLWQVDSAGFRVTQALNWQLAQPAAVGVVTGFGAAP